MQTQLTWWIHKVKMHQVINTELFQLQHNRSQVGSENLRVGVILERDDYHVKCI